MVYWPFYTYKYCTFPIPSSTHLSRGCILGRYRCENFTQTAYRRCENFTQPACGRCEYFTQPAWGSQDIHDYPRCIWCWWWQQGGGRLKGISVCTMSSRAQGEGAFIMAFTVIVYASATEKLQTTEMKKQKSYITYHKFSFVALLTFCDCSLACQQ